jgi:putative DNA-invertase from lambdoid prophage Rac
VKADQKARGRYLGGIMPFGYRLGDDGELIPPGPSKRPFAR